MLTTDDVLRMAEAAGFGRLLPARGSLPACWHGQDIARLEQFAADAIAAADAAQPLGQDPVDGDLLPAIGEEVLIHLASSDKWVPHRVVGYYAWGDRGGNKSLHRVFVRVVDRDGYQNARLLCDVRRTGEGRTQQSASAQPVAVPCSQAALDVLAERRRQIEAEGWTPENDDKYLGGQLAAAAAAYAMTGCHSTIGRICPPKPPGIWPWDQSWWKPSTTRRDLVKAAALLLAEIERIDRAAAQKPEGGE